MVDVILPPKREKSNKFLLLLFFRARENLQRFSMLEFRSTLLKAMWTAKKMLPKEHAERGVFYRLPATLPINPPIVS